MIPNKLMIIDDELVMTGNYNFTISADIYNYENTIFIFSKNLAAQYLTEYNKILNKVNEKKN